MEQIDLFGNVITAQNTATETAKTEALEMAKKHPRGTGANQGKKTPQNPTEWTPEWTPVADRIEAPKSTANQRPAVARPPHPADANPHTHGTANGTATRAATSTAPGTQTGPGNVPKLPPGGAPRPSSGPSPTTPYPTDAAVYLTRGLEVYLLPATDPRAAVPPATINYPGDSRTFERLDLVSLPVWYTRMQAAGRKLPPSQFTALYARWQHVADWTARRFASSDLLVVVLTHQLATAGFSVFHSATLGTEVLAVRDRSVCAKLPPSIAEAVKAKTLPVYSVIELTELQAAGFTPDDLKSVHTVKNVSGGRIIRSH